MTASDNDMQFHIDRQFIDDSTNAKWREIVLHSVFWQFDFLEKIIFVSHSTISKYAIATVGLL
jgi:hypothetical protein